MSTYTLSTVKRGPNVILIFSVTRLQENIEQSSQPINIYDKAQVILKLYHTSSNSKFDVMFKKTESGTNGPVQLKICCTNLKKIFYAIDEWTQIQLDQSCSSKSSCQVDGKTVSFHLHTLAISFTLCDVTTPTHSLVNNQLYKDTDFTDFQLNTEDGSVSVHKAMLFIHSDMFRTMLNGECKETAEGHINIEGATVQTLQHLKDYMYLGTLPNEGLEPLLLLAERYLMVKLKADCIAKLVEEIKPENFDGLVQLACQNNIPELVKALVLHVPQDSLNSIYQEIIKQESNVKK